MANILHIHEVIFLIEKNNGRWDANELVEAIGAEWGNDIHFGACSGNAFPKEYALDFLLSRNKVERNAHGKIVLHSAMQICEGHTSFDGAGS